MVAKVIAQKMTKKCKGMDIFKSNFSYDEAFFSELENEPITVENFVEGDFTKYVTNDGNSCVPDVGKDAIFEQAEALVHFSFEDSSKKLLLLDIQGSGYKLYDPEIATADDLSSDSDENYFCAGNLRGYAIKNFFRQHHCKTPRVYNIKGYNVYIIVSRKLWSGLVVV